MVLYDLTALAFYCIARFIVIGKCSDPSLAVQQGGNIY
jgi:hypothetical protein